MQNTNFVFLQKPWKNQENMRKLQSRGAAGQRRPGQKFKLEMPGGGAQGRHKQGKPIWGQSITVNEDRPLDLQWTVLESYAEKKHLFHPSTSHSPNQCISTNGSQSHFWRSTGLPYRVLHLEFPYDANILEMIRLCSIASEGSKKNNYSIISVPVLWYSRLLRDQVVTPRDGHLPQGAAQTCPQQCDQRRVWGMELAPRHTGTAHSKGRSVLQANASKASVSKQHQYLLCWQF